MTTTPGPRTPTHEESLAILSQVTMAMTTLTPAESVAGVLARHGIKLPQQPARDLTAGPADVDDAGDEPELTAREWKAGVERFLLTWGQAGNILREEGNEDADDLIPELLAPLWEMTDLGDEHRPVQEHQLAERHESAEVVAAMLYGLAEALADQGRSPR
jgi:hypothetical protein